nr:hypothetical protein [Stenotrophomonas lactitubi]
MVYPDVCRRMPLVIEDPVQHSQVRRVTIRPSVNVLGPDVDDGPIVAGNGGRQQVHHHLPNRVCDHKKTAGHRVPEGMINS